MSSNVIQYKIYKITYEIFFPKTFNLKLMKPMNLTSSWKEMQRMKRTCQRISDRSPVSVSVAKPMAGCPLRPRRAPAEVSPTPASDPMMRLQPVPGGEGVCWGAARVAWAEWSPRWKLPASQSRFGAAGRWPCKFAVSSGCGEMLGGGVLSQPSWPGSTVWLDEGGFTWWRPLLTAAPPRLYGRRVTLFCVINMAGKHRFPRLGQLVPTYLFEWKS